MRVVGTVLWLLCGSERSSPEHCMDAPGVRLVTQANIRHSSRSGDPVAFYNMPKPYVAGGQDRSCVGKGVMMPCAKCQYLHKPYPIA